MAWSNAEKSLLKERLQELGLWSQFVDHRDRLKDQGLTPVDARIAAIRAFPQVAAEFLPEADRSPAPPAPATLPVTAPPPTPAVPRPIDESNNGHQPSNAGVRGAIGVASSPGRVAGSDYDYGEPSFPQMPSEPAAQDILDKHQDAASEADIIRWVFDNLKNNTITEEEAPSSGAWGLQQACKSDITTRRFFYTQIWSKLLTGKNLDDNGSAAMEEADAICGLLNKIEAHSRAAFDYVGRQN